MFGNSAPRASARAARPSRLAALLLCGLSIAACGGDSTAPAARVVPVDCTGQPILQPAPGEHVVVDPAATNNCLRLPAAGAGGAEYLIVGFSTTGQVKGEDVGLTPHHGSGQRAEAMAGLFQSRRRDVEHSHLLVADCPEPIHERGGSAAYIEDRSRPSRISSRDSRASG